MIEAIRAAFIPEPNCESPMPAHRDQCIQRPGNGSGFPTRTRNAGDFDTIREAGEIGTAAALVHSLDERGKRLSLTRGFVESMIEPMSVIVRCSTGRQCERIPGSRFAMGTSAGFSIPQPHFDFRFVVLPRRLTVIVGRDAFENAADVGIVVGALLRPAPVFCSKLAFLRAPLSNCS